MKRLLLLGTLAFLATACGSTAHALVADRSVRIATQLPPAPSAWRDYPDFAARHSCWARNAFGGGVMRVAPSYPTLEPAAPEAIVRKVLDGLADRRYVRRVELGSVPPKVRASKAWFGGRPPPRDALWAYIDAPAVGAQPPVHPTPDQVLAASTAGWELAVVEGALRDRFCAAGGRPLV